MADRLLQISWSQPVRGREERSLEVFDATMGVLGRRQQEGRIESFDVNLLRPNAQERGGSIDIRGTQRQIDELQEDPEFTACMIDAALAVNRLAQCEGYCGSGVSEQMERYREAATKVHQTA